MAPRLTTNQWVDFMGHPRYMAAVLQVWMNGHGRRAGSLGPMQPRRRRKVEKVHR